MQATAVVGFTLKEKKDIKELVVAYQQEYKVRQVLKQQSGLLALRRLRCYALKLCNLCHLSDSRLGLTVPLVESISL